MALLQERGLEVDSNAAALSYLARIGYYRLSGYWYPFRELDGQASLEQGKPVRKGLFLQGSRFKDVIDLYVFDKKLRLLALDALERIEMAVRVDVAYLLGKFDPCAHENAAFLHGNFTKKRRLHGLHAGKTEHQLWLEKHTVLVHQARKQSFIQHHQARYGGKLPIWVAIEVWDFGQMSKLYAGMRHADQQPIARKYGAQDGESFSKWLRSLNFMRNVSAHHSRLWNINVLELSPAPKNQPQWRGINNARPFFYFCLMQKMLLVLCPNSCWNERFIALMDAFPKTECKAVSLQDFGVVPGWREWEIWKRK
ncbi:MAG TPA: Abi family protein [Eoetvoesiella sp.]